jgi:acetylornithine deacetylase/succinyl-diaminopimelate desuccinylase-like protein
VRIVDPLLELAVALVRIESINPGLDPGGAGEAGAAGVVAEWAASAGLEVEIQSALPGRPNVIVTARGTGGGRRLLLNGHLDTVGVANMERPFRAEVRDGRLHGRGAYDMKGALASALVATARAREEPLRGDVVVACVIDEELASAGTECLLAAGSFDAAIVCEPTDELVCVAHKGFVGFEIETQGRAAHGSRPDLGIDAIARMGPVLSRLSQLAATLAERPGHVLLGTGSIHASLIEGGQEYSSYPERCVLIGERRTIPGEEIGDLERELIGLVAETSATTRITFSRPPFESDRDGELARQMALGARGAEFCGLPFWTDAALLAEAGIPTVVYGPRGAGAHADDEWVETASLERCARAYLHLARAICA